MTHPHHEHRAHKHEKARVHHITKGYASGGAVHEDAAEDREMIASAVHKHEHHMHKGEKETKLAHGGRAHHRADHPHRAKGGRVKKNSKATVVNINVAPQAAQQPPHPVPVPVPGGPGGAAPPGPPPGAGMPPMGARPPIPGAGGPPGTPPGMPMRASGGRVSSKVKEASIRAGTKVQHTDGKKDGKDIGRPKPVTYATGGPVEPVTAWKKGMGPNGKGAAGGPDMTKKMLHGNAIEHPAKGGMGPSTGSGRAGAVARLEMTHRAAKHYRKAG